MRKNLTKTIDSSFSFLSKNAVVALRNASFISEHMQEEGISNVSLMISILLNEECLASKIITKMGLDRAEMLNLLFDGRVVDVLGDSNKPRELNLTNETKEILRKSYDLAIRRSHVYVGTEHLFYALLGVSNNPKISKIKRMGLKQSDFLKALNKYAIYPIGFLYKPDRYVESGEDDSVIDNFGVDIVDLAKKGKLDPVIGRDSEILQIVNILSRRKKNNPIIIGDAGVGKTVLIEGLAQRIAEGRVPSSLKNFKIIALDVADIIAGSKMRGDVEEKVLGIIQDVISSNNSILFIDEIHNIVSQNSQGGSLDISSVLKPALLEEGFRCIGTTTTEEYSMFFEQDSALKRRFQPVILNEVSISDAHSIVDRMRLVLEKHHNVKISDEAVKASILLTDRYVNDRALPDKAIDALDEAAASKRVEVELEFKDISIYQKELEVLRKRKEEEISSGNMDEALKLQNKEGRLLTRISKYEKDKIKTQRSKNNQVITEDIKRVISKWTGIPLNTLGDEEKKVILNLERILKQGIVGQDEACDVVASAIKRARAGILDKDRPWASFLFLGPTGVGKTELAKVLTKELFGSENRLIQIDMSELMEMHSVSKLIGSPPGYIGYQQGGWLTEKVKRSPHSVILFDEIEKAHPDVLNILLQILEYGHLTDGRGVKVNFKNTVVVLTSNIGAEEIRTDKVLGFVQNGKKGDKELSSAYDAMKNTLLEELKNTLRPELLNRLDDIVIFRSLSLSDAKKIVVLLLRDLNTRLEEEGYEVKLDSKAVKYIAQEGFEEQYGARPLRRVLQSKLESLLAEYILTNQKVNKDGVVIKVTLKDNRLVIF